MIQYSKNVKWLGASLSTLCMMHCVITPLSLTLLPSSWLWATGEWWHYVLLALVMMGSSSLLVFWGTRTTFFLGISGTLLLILALVLPWHGVETGLTVVGSLLLIMGHIIRHRVHSRISLSSTVWTQVDEKAV